VKVLPEFESIVITYSHEGEGFGWFDAGKLERVILNLFFNAGEAVPPDSGRIEVTSRVSERGAEIRVADNGPAIPDSIRENLFQPFVSYGKAKGIGLGLTAVTRSCRTMAAKSSSSAPVRTGSVFKLFLPMVKVAESLTKV